MQPYTLIRSARKSLALQVGADLSVIVRAPRHVPKREIDSFVTRNSGWIERQQERQRKRALARPALTEGELLALAERAKREIPPLVARYASIMGLKPTGIKITKAKTRFGSCSAKNSLCFSCLLLRYPPAAIEYVVVHELAHIRHKDHSAAFYALVGSVLPDYMARRRLSSSISCRIFVVWPI